MENFLSTINELNKNIFLFFNQIFGHNHLDSIMIFLDKFGGPHVFHLHLILIMSIAAILLFYKKNDKTKTKEFLILGFIASLTLCLSIIFGLIIAVNCLKYLFAIERPFCSLSNIHTTKEIVKNIACPRSFPSGHMSFSIIMVASFWQLLNKFFKTTFSVFLVVLAISRMASGAHYPIDLIGAIVICLPITIFIKKKIEKIIVKKEKELDLFNKIYLKYFTSKDH